MIPSSCVGARGGFRRMLNPPFLARNPISGKPSHVPSGLRTPHISRRHNASKPPFGQQAPSAPQTIPGPSWLWLEPFRAYGRVQQRKPYMTQFVSALVIYFVGDLVAQSIAPPATPQDVQQAAEENIVEKGRLQQWSDDRDWARTCRALVIGGLSSIPSYKWFLWLGNNFNYSSKIASLTVKVAVNQALFTPIFNSYFFGMQTLLSGATLPEIIERIKNTVPTSWINSCKVWPIFTAFSFTYIPIQYRSIFGGVLAIGWQTYLSLLNQRAAAKEEKKHESDLGVAAHTKDIAAQEQREQEKQKCIV